MSNGISKLRLCLLKNAQENPLRHLMVAMMKKQVNKKFFYQQKILIFAPLHNFLQ